MTAGELDRLGLRYAYEHDPYVRAIIDSGRMQQRSTTETLAQCVVHLSAARQSAIDAYAEHLQRCPPAFVIVEKAAPDA